VHTWVGAFMSSLASAAMDPVFFLVHCFVDLLWAAWQACNQLTPLQDSDVTNLNPKIWNWAASPTFSGDNANMPWFVSGRTPKDAFDIDLLGYQYTSGFISNVVALANANWCSVRSAGFTKLLQAQERHAKRHAISHDPKNPPRVVATSFLEAYTNSSGLPSYNTKKGSGKTVGLASAKRKKILAVTRGTLSKPGCYTPKKDEVTNLKSFASVYKKVRRGSSQDAAIAAVRDAECNAVEYQSGQVSSNTFIESMGSMAIKNRAQGKYNHDCYLKQQGIKADALKSDYQKDLEKKGKYRKPRRVTVNKPAARFTTMEEGGPPPPAKTNVTPTTQQYSYRFSKRSEQNALGPI